MRSTLMMTEVSVILINLVNITMMSTKVCVCGDNGDGDC